MEYLRALVIMNKMDSKFSALYGKLGVILDSSNHIMRWRQTAVVEVVPAAPPVTADVGRREEFV